MTPEALQERIAAIAQQREALVRLSQQENLGTLQLDAKQALEEMDDLIAELSRTFPQP
ncbi:MAG: hypothetical protein HC918_11515 [Oscillatoriales cyanobacterium SM2_1_8]|nr:hypothetical protein [Oscillatoriales cyanobacterium SM2_1_8]